MQIIGHGVDLVQISRMREILERQGEHFRDRVFSPEERKYCEARPDPAVHFAARYAAKEAFAKATNVGMKGSGVFGGVWVVNLPDGRPEFAFSEEVIKRLKIHGVKGNFLSLSHDGDFAMASVILLGEK